MPHRLPPRNPLDEWILLAFGLIFWLSILVGVPTFVEWATRWAN